MTYEKGLAGAGTTRYADERQPYVLTDRATSLSLGKEVP